jgi:hypothetical protein
VRGQKTPAELSPAELEDMRALGIAPDDSVVEG